MNISPKQLLNQLVKNNVITQEEANRIEVESLKKNIPIDKYLFENTDIKRAEILKSIAQVEAFLMLI